MSFTAKCVDDEGNQESGQGHSLAKSSSSDNIYSDVTPTAVMHADSVVGGGTMTIGDTGNGQGHDNMPPVGCINFIIALEGIYPSRN